MTLEEVKQFFHCFFIMKQRTLDVNPASLVLKSINFNTMLHCVQCGNLSLPHPQLPTLFLFICLLSSPISLSFFLHPKFFLLFCLLCFLPFFSFVPTFISFSFLYYKSLRNYFKFVMVNKSYEESMCPRNVNLSKRTLRNVFITRPSSFFGKTEKKTLKTVKRALGDRDEASRQEQGKSGTPSKRRPSLAVKVPWRWERDNRCLSYEDSS